MGGLQYRVQSLPGSISRWRVRGTPVFPLCCLMIEHPGLEWTSRESSGKWMNPWSQNREGVSVEGGIECSLQKPKTGMLAHSEPCGKSTNIHGVMVNFMCGLGVDMRVAVGWVPRCVIKHHSGCNFEGVFG